MHASNDRLVLSPSDLNDYVECPHLITLALEVARGARKRAFVPDDQRDLLRRKDEEHEARYLAGIKAQGRQAVVEQGGVICSIGDHMVQPPPRPALAPRAERAVAGDALRDERVRDLLGFRAAATHDELEGIALVRLKSGTVRKAELHGYEAHGIGRKEIKRTRYVG
jgi:hypothetical protein